MSRRRVFFAACLVVAACSRSPRFIVIMSERGTTLRGRPFSSPGTLAKGACILPAGSVVVFRVGGVFPLRAEEPPVLGMAGRVYRVAGDCRSFDEIGAIDPAKTDDQLAAEFGVAGEQLMKPETASPVEITKDFYRALNSGQTDAAMRLVADGATFSKAWPADGTLEGQQRIRAHLEMLRDTGTAFELRGIRPGMLEASYRYRVVRAGQEVARGTGRTRVSNGRIESDGDDACHSYTGCSPAVVFVRGATVQVRPRLADWKPGTLTGVFECWFSAGGGKEKTGVAPDVVVVFRDGTVIDQISGRRAVRPDDIYRVGDGCELEFFGKAARGQSDDEIAAVFSIGVPDADAIEVPLPAAPIKPPPARLP